MGKFFNNPNWSSHFYFLVRDLYGVWFAGSPANYWADIPDNPMTRIVVAASLKEMIGKIEDLDGGRCPNPGFMQRELAKKYQPPIVGLNFAGEQYVSASTASFYAGSNEFSQKIHYIKSGYNRTEEVLGIPMKTWGGKYHPSQFTQAMGITA